MRGTAPKVATCRALRRYYLPEFPASLVGIHMNGVGPGGPLPSEASDP